MKLNRKARIEKAADDCMANAADTIVDRFGRAKTQAMSFNEYQGNVDAEALAQAAYFADENDVTRAEVVKALGIAE